MIEIKKGWRITEAEHVVQFMRYVLDLGIRAFHPDDDMCSYIDLETNEPTFSVEDGKYLNETIEQCFVVCGDDVYDICLAIMDEKIENQERIIEEGKKYVNGINTRQQIMNNPEALAIMKDALEKGVLIDGFSLVDDNIIVIDDTDTYEENIPIRRRSSPLGYLGIATSIAQMAYLPYIDDIVLSDSRRTKKIDIYREHKPDPDAQPRNERCKCGSGKKYKQCCIKK